ncbi:hypothetical protein ACVWXM_003071 [Bradyrhizobium sp. GM7.3]
MSSGCGANPTDPLENFVDKWAEHPERAKPFFEWLQKARTEFAQAARSNDRKLITETVGRGVGGSLADRAARRRQPPARPALLKNRIGGAGQCRSVLSRQEPRSNEAAGVRRRGMIWWLENPGRARSERQSVAELAERVSWLKNLRWYLSDGAALAVDFEIDHDGRSVPLTMTYAEFHPNAPPIVVPRDGSRLSSHQYGAGGNLCLEYRADNWEGSLTAMSSLPPSSRRASLRGAFPPVRRSPRAGPSFHPAPSRAASLLASLSSMRRLDGFLR